MKIRRLLLPSAIAVALLATACGGGGGGGGNVKPEAPPPVEPPPPPSEPDPDPDPTPEPPPPRYAGAKDNILVPTNVDLAHEAGFTGKGVKIGLLDDQVREPYPTLGGKMPYYVDHTANPGEPEPETNKLRGHGAAIAASMVGAPDESIGFKGGIAPDADLFWARICADNSCGGSAVEKAVVDLADRGVRLFNLSIGGQAESPEEAQSTSRAWVRALYRVYDDNGLALFSTGNDGSEASDYPAAAPEFYPHIQNNWLAVTAVNVEDDGSVKSLADYANVCGEAAQWCLAAPGLTFIPAVPDSEFKTYAQGTSMATGLVTGVGALVWGAYPWMTGVNVQHTLLSTAQDLGAEGVDDVFGWGLVDAEKAVHGPGQFFKPFDANVTGGSFEFSNDISGDHGLIKDGAGTLVLSGENTYKGDTLINEGILAFSGSTASDVVVNQGGTYSARQGGLLKGDYTALTGAATHVQVGNPLTIEGDAALDGELRLFNPAKDYVVEGRETILTAGSVTGEFADTSHPDGFFWTAELGYTDSEVHADLTRVSGAASAAAFGSGQAVIDGASQMDSLVGLIDGAIEDGGAIGMESLMAEAAAVMNATGSAVTDSLASLTGQVHGTARTIGINGAINSARLHADRLPDLAGATQRSAWISATHVDGDLDRTGYADASYRQDEVTVGVDVPVGNAVVGASITGGEVRGNIAGTRDALDSTSVGFTLYGVKAMGPGYLSGSVGYTDLDVDTRRDILVGGELFNALADRGETVWHGRVEAGFNLANGLTPFAAVGGIHQEQEAFTESTESALGLQANADNQDLAYADVGVRHRTHAGRWLFDSMLAYRNVFSGQDTSYNAAFVGAPEATFSVNGQPVGKEAVRAVLGLSYAPTSKLRLFGNVGTEKISGQQDNATAQVGLSVAF